ncbi:MAG: hypothetical protein LBS90_03605 [Oscillospiraceae bacterium]|jgi:hypothetical protein|nr:hypothetical protein [Oscillospiraceae bacterium]
MRRFLRDNLTELLGTAAEAAGAGLDGVCAEGLAAIGTALRENLTAEDFAKYDGVFTPERIDALSALLQAEPVLKEIVFFPYKASMWDSLESVYFAAKSDPECFVSVVPVPYCEFENGEALHRYEGAMFPGYVEITDWRDYDISLFLPDIAYVHNAYDDRNLVTRVEERYFTRNLKNYVDILVYIPYYASDTRPAPAFAATASECAADIVIASSELAAGAFVQAGARQDIAVLGSPKTDRIINPENSAAELPPEWAVLRGKKVFFLNTSLSSMLLQTEAYFGKLTALFGLFAGRGDAALLWRPHPLTGATIGAMRPQLKAMFEVLKSKIREFGVLDESPDMGAAIRFSDAYIGDGSSSLVYLYALTGKPMYILNFKLPLAPEPELREELSRSDVIGWGFVTPGSDEWGFSAAVNALYRIDTGTAEAKFVSSVPDEKNTAGLYGAPVRVGNRLILSPGLARSWAIYDTDGGVWEKIPVPAEAVPEKAVYPAFGGAINCGGFLLYVPGASGTFAKYDIASGGFSYYRNWFGEKLSARTVDIAWGVFSGVCECGGYHWFVSPQCNIITRLNPKTMSFRYFAVGAADYRYKSIAYAGGRFWLIKYREPGLNPWQDGVIAWTQGSANFTEYLGLPLEQNPLYSGGGISVLISNGGALYAFPLQGDAILKITPDGSNPPDVSRYALDPPFDFFERKSPYYIWANEQAFPWVLPGTDGGTAFAQMPYDYSLLTLDIQSGRYRRCKWNVKGAETLLAAAERLLPTPWVENAFLTPDDFIADLLSGRLPAFDAAQAEYYRGLNANSDGTSGAKIHAYVKAKQEAQYE